MRLARETGHVPSKLSMRRRIDDLAAPSARGGGRVKKQETTMRRSRFDMSFRYAIDGP
jgi:hypothetical protein